MTAPVSPSHSPNPTVLKVSPHASVTDPAVAIDVRDVTVTDYWAYRLGVSRDTLFAAIGEVGSSVAAVRRHLHK